MKKLLIPLLVAVSFILGYFGGRYSGRLPRARSGVAKSEAVLGPWKASFHIPGTGSVQMPEKSPFVKCDVPRQTVGFPYPGLHVIITNLTARPYFVSDQVYGYNAKGQRVSDGNDDIAMAGHESVNRVVYLDSHVSQGFGREDYGRAFVVVMSLKQ